MSFQSAADVRQAPGPSPGEILRARSEIAGALVRTPQVELACDRLAPHLPEGVRATMKLELLQQAGSFKARGAFLNVSRLDEAARTRGVVAVSAGNHALAVAWAGGKAGVPVKTIMFEGVDPARIAGCRALGAEVVIARDVASAFALMERVAADEGRAVIHPFDGETTVLGTATCGAEMIEDAPDLDLAIVPVGGGGLIAGMARAIRLARPDCAIVGVEPVGADAMARSFATGGPVRLETVATIADSLGAPMTRPYSLEIARAHVDEIVRIEDAEMIKAMRLLYDGLKLACEPACAASLAALIGPVAARARGKRVGLIACGSNIGLSRFAELIA